MVYLCIYRKDTINDESLVGLKFGEFPQLYPPTIFTKTFNFLISVRLLKKFAKLSSDHGTVANSYLYMLFLCKDSGMENPTYGSNRVVTNNSDEGATNEAVYEAVPDNDDVVHTQDHNETAYDFIS